MIIITPYPDNMELPYNLLLDADPSKKLVDSYLKKGYLFGAFDNGLLAGEYLLIIHDNSTAEIINLAVLEKYRNKSIGKKLISHAENQARVFGCNNIIIGTAEPLVKYYTNQGYVYKKTVTNFFKDNYDTPVIDNGVILSDMIVLEKKL